MNIYNNKKILKKKHTQLTQPKTHGTRDNKIKYRSQCISHKSTTIQNVCQVSAHSIVYTHRQDK